MVGNDIFRLFPAKCLYHQFGADRGKINDMNKIIRVMVAVLILTAVLSSCKMSSDIEEPYNFSSSASIPENTVKESQFTVESESIHTSVIENKFTVALSEDEIADALKVAETYYEKVGQQVNELLLASEEIYTMFSIQEDAVGRVLIFEGEDSKIGVNRYIVLEYISEEWTIKNEGF